MTNSHPPSLPASDDAQSRLDAELSKPDAEFDSATALAAMSALINDTAVEDEIPVASALVAVVTRKASL